METQIQKEKIKDYLESGKTITSLEALDIFKCFRLASRISELKQEGYPVTKQMIQLDSGKYVAEYFKQV
tara:strand:- start:1401 stop:1607 length:207 start_codon:yes stop_codon:yes gene_type:complete